MKTISITTAWLRQQFKTVCLCTVFAMEYQIVQMEWTRETVVPGPHGESGLIEKYTYQKR